MISFCGKSALLIIFLVIFFACNCLHFNDDYAKIIFSVREPNNFRSPNGISATKCQIVGEMMIIIFIFIYLRSWAKRIIWRSIEKPTITTPLHIIYACIICKGNKNTSIIRLIGAIYQWSVNKCDQTTHTQTKKTRYKLFVQLF